MTYASKQMVTHNDSILQRCFYVYIIRFWKNKRQLNVSAHAVFLLCPQVFVLFCAILLRNTNQLGFLYFCSNLRRLRYCRHSPLWLLYSCFFLNDTTYMPRSVSDTMLAVPSLRSISIILRFFLWWVDIPYTIVGFRLLFSMQDVVLLLKALSIRSCKRGPCPAPL